MNRRDLALSSPPHTPEPRPHTRMDLLWSLALAAVITVIIWVLGGSSGAWLNAPGLLVLRGAKALGIPATPRQPSLREWLWLGSLLSALFWWLAAYAALSAVRRYGRRRNREGEA